jgi:glutamine amidotransferase-like uncharacterized protein
MVVLTSGGAALGACSRPKAVVYRGPASSPGCPESVAELLEKSPSNFDIVYAGPHEDVDVNSDTLQDAQVYAHGGGPDLHEAYDLTKQYQSAIRNFVRSGGHYLGFCLGAYLAGPSDGYGLLPDGVSTAREIKQNGAQVKTDDDTIIQVNWTFTNGSTENARWLYFQDGVVVQGLDDSSPGQILGRYSSNGNIAASLTPYGQGWVGLVGPHPEADKEWCKSRHSQFM